METADFNDVVAVCLQRLSREHFRSTFSSLLLRTQKDVSVPQYGTASDAVFESQKLIARKTVSRPSAVTSSLECNLPLRNAHKLRDFNCHKYFLLALRKCQHEKVRLAGDESVNNPRVPPNLLNCCLPPAQHGKYHRLNLFD